MDDGSLIYENPTVLVVDDTPEDLAFITGLLQDQYKVKIANNGEGAIQVARTTTPLDIILMDIMMPVMDGYEACRQLKDDPETKDIPIIFLTACRNIIFEPYIKTGATRRP